MPPKTMIERSHGTRSPARRLSFSRFASRRRASSISATSVTTSCLPSMRSRLREPMASASSPRPTCQRADSGIRRIPIHSAIAGIEQSTSMKRQAWPLPSETVTPAIPASTSQDTLAPASWAPEGSFSTTAVGPPWIEAMIALKAKAASWPVTIMSWSTATSMPRCSLGADSER